MGRELPSIDRRPPGGFTRLGIVLCGVLAVGVALGSAGCATPSRRAARVGPPPPPATVAVVAASEARSVSLGESVDGRPLELRWFGDAAHGPVTLIVGGIHGNEPTSAAVAEALVAHLRAEPASLGGRAVAILTPANPDGLARRLRTNVNLVDLNRNFPAANWAKARRSAFFGGDAPGSEPETRAILRAFELARPARVVSIHAMAAPCNNFDGPGRSLAEAMARHNGYPVKATIGYPTPGSLGSWAGVDRGIPIITLELPAAAPAAKSWAENRGALLAAIRFGE